MWFEGHLILSFTGSRSKKLVPVLVKNCETPNILRHVTMCDFTRGDLTGWFWERLIKSLQAPLNPSEISLSSSSNLSDIEINVPPSKLGFSSPASSQVVASASPLCSGPVSSASAVHGHSLEVSSLTSGSGPVQAADCRKAISQTDYISVQRSSSLSSLTSSTPSSPASSRRKIVTPDKNQPSGSASKKSGKLMSKLQSVFSSHSSSNSWWEVLLYFCSMVVINVLQFLVTLFSKWPSIGVSPWSSRKKDARKEPPFPQIRMMFTKSEKVLH